jgi:dGTPase
VLGETHGERIRTLVVAVVDATVAAEAGGERRGVRMTEPVLLALDALRDFLYMRVYEEPKVRDEFHKAQAILGELWTWYHQHADEFRARWWPRGVSEEEGLDRAVCDFISGMTDRYALRAFEEVRMPRRWSVY